MRCADKAGDKRVRTGVGIPVADQGSAGRYRESIAVRAAYGMAREEEDDE